MRANLELGDRVEVETKWAPIAGGVVAEIDSRGLGFRIGRWWFGWHELKSITRPT